MQLALLFLLSPWQSFPLLYTAFVIWISGVPTIQGMLNNNYIHFVVHSTKTFFLYAQLQPHLSASPMGMFAWWVQQAVTKEEWRCVSMGCGEL